MLKQITSLLILPLVLYQGASTNKGVATVYEDPEAYEVYSAIVPSEWPVRVAHAKSLVIQTETKGYEMCLRPEKESAEKFGPAISAFVSLNKTPSLLQQRINIEIPYQLIMADQLNINSNGGWEGFYQ